MVAAHIAYIVTSDTYNGYAYLVIPCDATAVIAYQVFKLHVFGTAHYWYVAGPLGIILTSRYSPYIAPYLPT